MRLGVFLIIGGLAGLVVYLFTSEMKTVGSFGPTSWTKDHVADCGVVLTGGPGRVREGFDLLAQGNVKKLIISGVHPGAGLRDIFPEWTFYGDLKKNDVILERRSGTTYGNAQQTLVLVEALQCRDIVLVTSNLHMYRASRTFANIFPEEYPIYLRSILNKRLKPSFWDLGVESAKSLFYSIWAY